MENEFDPSIQMTLTAGQVINLTKLAAQIYKKSDDFLKEVLAVCLENPIDKRKQNSTLDN